MTIEEMKRRKIELGYTNEIISKLSGVPLGTVQKIFAGITKAPRMDTLAALTKVLRNEEKVNYTRDDRDGQIPLVGENHAEYHTSSETERLYTIEDYYSLPDDRRAELIDGKIYDLSCPSYAHQRILAELYIQIRRCIDSCGRDCEVLFAPFDVQLDRDEYTMLQPDLMVFCGMENIRRHLYYGAPEFVVEIISPSTRSRDMVLKLNKYMNAGVREYWVVDPDNDKVYVYFFEAQDYPWLFEGSAQIPVNISGGICSIDFGTVFGAVRDLPEE